MIYSLRVLVSKLLNWVMPVVTFFLGGRVLLTLLSANPATPAVAWIYQVSEVMIYPFRGLIVNPLINNQVVDLVALIALLCYALLANLLIELWIDLTQSDQEHEEVITEHHHRKAAVR